MDELISKRRELRTYKADLERQKAAIYQVAAQQGYVDPGQNNDIRSIDIALKQVDAALHKTAGDIKDAREQIRRLSNYASEAEKKLADHDVLVSESLEAMAENYEKAGRYSLMHKARADMRAADVSKAVTASKIEARNAAFNKFNALVKSLVNSGDFDQTTANGLVTAFNNWILSWNAKDLQAMTANELILTSLLEGHAGQLAAVMKDLKNSIEELATARENVLSQRDELRLAVLADTSNTEARFDLAQVSESIGDRSAAIIHYAAVASSESTFAKQAYEGLLRIASSDGLTESEAAELLSHLFARETLRDKDNANDLKIITAVVGRQPGSRAAAIAELNRITSAARTRRSAAVKNEQFAQVGDSRIVGDRALEETDLEAQRMDYIEARFTAAINGKTLPAVVEPAEAPLTIGARIDALRDRYMTSPSADIFLELADLYRTQGEDIMSLACLEQCVAAFPNSGKARSYLAERYLEMGQYEAAGRYAESALQLNVKMPSAHAVLGRVYQKRGSVAEAIASYEKALEYGSQDPAVRGA